MGKVRKISSGRKTALSRPSKIAVTIRETGLSIFTQGRILTTTNIASAVTSVLSKNLFKNGPFVLAIHSYRKTTKYNDSFQEDFWQEQVVSYVV
jgi:hypothetical protein